MKDIKSRRREGGRLAGRSILCNEDVGFRHNSRVVLCTSATSATPATVSNLLIAALLWISTITYVSIPPPQPSLCRLEYFLCGADSLGDVLPPTNP